MIRQQSIGTAIIVINKQKQILLGKRINCVKSGFFGLPGGKLDKGEMVLNSAIRELNEETNLSAKKIKCLTTVKEWQDDQGCDFVHFVFLCNEWVGKVKLMEPDRCESWKWFNVNEIPKKILPAHLAGIKSLISESKDILIDI